MRRGLLTVLVTVLLLASFATADQLNSRKPRRHAKKDRKNRPEPDPSKPQRKFRGGRVRHPTFEGSGCPESSVLLVNSSDTSSFALSALFSQFQSQTTGSELRDLKTCTITVVLEPEPNMSIGVAHVDFRGSAYVPEGSSTSPDKEDPTTEKVKTFARLQAAYKVTGARREPVVDKTYAAGFDDFVYEEANVDPVVWTPCDRSAYRDRVFEFRIKATITAVKARAKDADVMIAVDTSDSTLQKGLYYQLTTRPCEGVATITTPPTAPPTVTPCPSTEDLTPLLTETPVLTPTVTQVLLETSTPETPAPELTENPTPTPVLTETPTPTPLLTETLASLPTETQNPVVTDTPTLSPTETETETKSTPTVTPFPTTEAPLTVAPERNLCS